VDDNLTVFQSRARCENLREFISKEDPLEKDIIDGYESDRVFKKILKHPGDHPEFYIRDGLVWRKNKGDEEVLCISTGPSLHGRIINEAHTIVGHFGAQRTADYIWCWYWWPQLQKEVQKFCKSCELCMHSKGEGQSPRGKLHTLPIPTRPWDSIGMDFMGPFHESDSFDYLWVIICHMTSMVHLVLVKTTTTASELSLVYLREIVHLHGLLLSIVSD
jgi:hypothetical protein